MKKSILCIVASFLVAFSSFAQDSLKVSARHFTTELNVNPFNGNINLNNSLNQIKFRYFFKDNAALRMGFAVKNRKVYNEYNSPYGPSPSKFEDSRKTNSVALNLGIEKHLKGTSRLSPYFGAELALGFKTSSQTIKGLSTETTVKGGWSNNLGSGTYEEIAFFSYGCNLIGGFDFYIAKNLYLGYEVALGFSKIKYKDLEMETKSSSGSVSKDNFDSKSTDFTFGPTLLNGIRIGYAF